jgi:C4-dicarboxylate-specific signal transduction histidine kinase
MSTPTLPARLLARARSRRRRHAAMTAEQGRRLAERVTVLEAGLEESRRLNQRLADVVDVVTEVLVPAADRDDERLRKALANLNKTLDSPEDSAD